MDMVCPLWKRAWGGHLGFRRWVSLKSARKAPAMRPMEERVRTARPGVGGGIAGRVSNSDVGEDVSRTEGGRHCISKNAGDLGPL